MRWLALGVLFGGLGSVAQQPAPVGVPSPPPMVSPQAAYDDSTRPVEIVRKSIANWSDVELMALGVAMKKAAVACGERKDMTYAGDDLIALSRLCSFGQQWPESKAAAAKYIAAEDAAPKTQLSLAYGLQLDATLHMHDLKEIMTNAKAMLAGVPYDATVNEACDGAISYLQVAYTKEALELEAIRQPLLLAVMAAELDAQKPTVPLHSLYASGLSQAALMQYQNMPEDAAGSVAALDKALGDEAKLSADEMVPIGEARKQYGLLGKPLPTVTPTLSLANLEETPVLDARFDAGTALLLFPDWCAQCVGLRGDLWKAEQTKQGIVKLVVLLAEAAPDKDALKAEARAEFTASMARAQAMKAGSNPAQEPPKTAAPEKPKTAAELLLHTQTMVVPAETTALFASGDFPFVVMVDHAGIVRFAGSAPETVLRPGDFLDRVVEHVAETWPPPVGKVGQ